MTERPLCRDVSLQAARECLADAATHLRAAVSDVAGALGFAVAAIAHGPTMRAVERPMPAPSAEAEARFAAMCEELRAATAREDARRAREAMAQHDTLMRRRARSIGEPICVCGDCPVVVGEPCAACAEVGT